MLESGLMNLPLFYTPGDVHSSKDYSSYDFLNEVVVDDLIRLLDDYEIVSSSIKIFLSFKVKWKLRKLLCTL